MSESLLINEYNPYLGLNPYEEAHHKFFCGREKQTQYLLDFVKQHTLTILYGRSGYGKTSLLKAGLFPLLRKYGFFPVYLRLSFDQSEKSLIKQIQDTVEDELDRVKSTLSPSFEDLTLWEYFHRLKLKNKYKTPIIVFDQFEEMFTLGQNKPEEVKALFKELGCVIQNWKPIAVTKKYGEGEIPFDFNSTNLRVIIGLREDYLKDLEEITPMIPRLRGEKIRLRRLKVKEAFEAIYTPAKKIISKENARFILEKILGELYPEKVSTENQDEIEPFMLSHILKVISDKRKNDEEDISIDLIKETNISNILESFYLENTTSEDRIQIEKLISNNVRIPILKADFGLSIMDISRLINNRIIRETDWNGNLYIELIHDVLIEYVGSEKKRQEAIKAKFNAELAIGNSSITKNQLMVAESHFTNAKKLAQTINDKLNQGLSLEKLGVVTQKRNQFEQALKYYEEALYYLMKADDYQATGRVHERIARLYTTIYKQKGGSLLQDILKNYKSAQQFYEVIQDDFGLERVVEYVHELEILQPWGYLVNLKTNKTEILSGKEVDIGRNSMYIINQIDLQNSYISRSHVVITSDLQIADKHSTNGTTINGEDLIYGKKETLKNGDIIGIAGHDALQFFNDKPQYSPLPDNTWGIFLNSNQPIALTESEYSVLLENQKVHVKEGLLPDIKVLMKLRFGIEHLFDLDAKYETELQSNDYSHEFYWEFSKQYLLNVIDPKNFQSIIDIISEIKGLEFTKELEDHFHSRRENTSFISEFAESGFIISYLSAKTDEKKSEYLLTYDLGSLYNEDFKRFWVRIKRVEDRLEVKEDNSEMYITGNPWQLIYPNKREQSRLWKLYSNRQWEKSNHPALICAHFSEGSNVPDQVGPKFQIILLNGL